MVIIRAEEISNIILQRIEQYSKIKNCKYQYDLGWKSIL